MTSRMEYSDEMLLKRYIDSKNSMYLGTFLVRYQQSLLRFVTSFLGDPHAAQDVVQETFLRVARSPKQLLKAKNRHNWLLRVARNTGIDRIRKDARVRKYTHAYEEQVARRTAADAVRPADAVETEELYEHVFKEINRLSPRVRDVVLLKIQEEKTYREISEITGLSVTNVGFILHRALKELSVRLQNSRGDLQ